MAEVLFIILATFSGKKGVIDYSGKVLIPFEYDVLRSNEDGTFVCAKAIQDVDTIITRWGVVDFNNREIIPFIYDEIGIFREGVFNAKLKGQWGFMDQEVS